jgi:hypothetical protein
MRESQRLCNACGKQNREQARFCGYCGQPLQKTTQTRDDALHDQKAPEWVREAKRGPSSSQIAEGEHNESYQNNKTGKTMKSISFAVVAVALLGLLVYTNPTLESYESFVHQQIIQESKSDQDRALALLFGGILSGIATNMTVRKDYVFLSTYDTNIGDEHLRVLGIMKNFFILETPRPLEARH